MPSERDDEKERGDEESADGTDRLGFSLPPIRLPPLFPEGFRVVLPLPGTRIALGGAHLLAAAVAADAADAGAALVLAPGPLQWFRAGLVAVVAVALVGRVGLVAAWELAAALAGLGPLGAAPTVTALVLLRARAARGGAADGP